MDLANIGLAGLKQAESRVEQASKRISRGTGPPESAEPSDTVDLATETVQLIDAVNSYTANLRLIQTADELEKHTINLLG
jgi:flagellar hook protein FlgE